MAKRLPEKAAKRRRLTVGRQIQVRIRAYFVVRDKLEEGLGFALNRLEEVADTSFDSAVRERAKEDMLGELLLALEGVVNWNKSG